MVRGDPIFALDAQMVRFKSLLGELDSRNERLVFTRTSTAF